MLIFSKHFYNKFGYVVALFFCIVTKVYAQNYIEILKLNAGTTPLNTFENSSTKSVLNEYGADLTLPIKINKKLALLTGLGYESFETKLFTDQKLQSFSQLVLKLGLNINLSENLSTTMVLLPKLATNFGLLTQKDFQMGAIVFLKYKVKPNLNYRVGLYYNAESFGPLFVPLLGIYYMSSNSRFEFSAMLPISADMNYKVIKILNVGINFNGQTKSYHTINISPQLKSAYVMRQTNEIFGYLRFNFGKNITVQTKVGQSFGRKFRVYADDNKVDFALPLTFINDHRKQLNTTFSNGLIFQVALAFRLSLPK